MCVSKYTRRKLLFKAFLSAEFSNIKHIHIVGQPLPHPSLELFHLPKLKSVPTTSVLELFKYEQVLFKKEPSGAPPLCQEMVQTQISEGDR